MSIETIASGVVDFLPRTKSELSLKLVRELDGSLSELIPRMVGSLYEETSLRDHLSKESFMRTTSQKIASATYLNTGGHDFFVLYWGDLPVGYALAEITTFIGGDLTYAVSQAWIRRGHRSHARIRLYIDILRERAKELLCKHLACYALVENARKIGRILGKRATEYFVVIKEDL